MTPAGPKASLKNWADTEPIPDAMVLAMTKGLSVPTDLMDEVTASTMVCLVEM